MQLAYRQGPTALRVWQSTAGNRPQTPAAPAHLVAWLDAPPLQQITLILPLDGSLRAAGEAVATGAISQLYESYPDPANRPQLYGAESGTLCQSAGRLLCSRRQRCRYGAGAADQIETSPHCSNSTHCLSRSLPSTNRSRKRVKPRLKLGWTTFSLAPEDEARQIADHGFGEPMSQRDRDGRAERSWTAPANGL